MIQGFLSRLFEFIILFVSVLGALLLIGFDLWQALRSPVDQHGYNILDDAASIAQEYWLIEKEEI